MKTKITTRQIAGVAIMTALVAALWAISTFVPLKPFSINLALLPIVIGACLYGPWWGLFLGAVDGFLIILDPATGGFLGANAVATVFLCLLKTGLGGLASGFMFQLIHKKNDLVAAIVASLILPIVNTGLFMLGSFIFFQDFLNSLGLTVVGISLTVNFAVEFAVAAVMSPVVYKLIKFAVKNRDIGSVYHE